jgi:hypothetical protein
MNRSMEPAARDLGYGVAHRRMTVDLILRYLDRSRQEGGHPTLAESLGRRQQLHRQPWRHRPRRPGVEGSSTMELIRRYEARLRAH